MSDIFIEKVKLGDKYRLTNMTDPGLIPQIIEGATQPIIEQIEGDVTKFIQTRLVDLNIDENILIKQTAEIKRLNDLLYDVHEKEEAGLLIELPYKVGDDFWMVWNSSSIGEDVPVHLKCVGYSITTNAKFDVRTAYLSDMTEPSKVCKFSLASLCTMKTFETEEECRAEIERRKEKNYA